MKAIVYREHGGLEVVRYEDVPEPKIGPTEVLLRVRASSCNYNDLWARRGLPAVKFAFPHLPGSDAAGEVVEVGSAVTSVKVGQKVVVHPGLSCRVCEYCTSGQEYFCRAFKIWGFQTGPLDGAHAEYAKLPEVNLIPMPEGLTFEEAASIPLVLLTAWHMLVGRAQIKAGDTVLVLGAGSGVGCMAVQIAKLMGAKVIATAGSDAKLEKAKEIGADEVINHSTQDIAAEVRRLTDRRGADIVFEHVGQATWEKSIQSLAWGGKLVICGYTTGYQAMTDLRFLFNKQLSLLGSHQGSKAELVKALKFVESGQIKPVLAAVRPLKEAAQAQAMMEQREHFGKIVLAR